MTVVAEPYGRDTSATNRIYPGVLVEGNRLLAEAAIRRLKTPRGRLLYAPNYGLAICALLGRDLTPAESASVPGQVRNELLKDDRLSEVRASLIQSRLPRQWELPIEFYPVSSGPFGLVLGISGVTLEVLREGGLNG